MAKNIKKRKINYSGFCAKYGARKMILAAIFAPAAANIPLQIMLGSEMSTIVNTTCIAPIIGLCSLGAANFAHQIANRALSNRNIGLSRGGIYTRRAQLAAYIAFTAFYVGEIYTKDPDNSPLSKSAYAADHQNNKTTNETARKTIPFYAPQ